MPDVKIPKVFKRITEKARIKVYYGGRGSAKSESVARYLLLCGKEESMNILCCREFQVSIKQSVHSLLAALIVEMELSNFYQVLETEIRGVNGTKFIFAGLKNNVANIKSMYNIKKCWCEEAQVLSENSINILLPTIRADDSEIIFTMNPILPTDPAYVRFVLNPPKDSIVVKVNYDQNPFFPDVLEKERLDLLQRDPIAYNNVWLGEPRESVEGAIYAKELQSARNDGRIGSFPVDLSKPVNLYADIGEANNFVLWCEQKEGLNRLMVDMIVGHNEKVPHYINEIQKRKFTVGLIVLPHDAEQNRANAEFTVKVMFQRAFPNAKVVVNPNFPGAVAAGIEAVRNIFPFLYFNDGSEGVRAGLFSLAHYHWKIDPDTGKSYGKEPAHEFSDEPDALRTLAMAFRVSEKKKQEARRQTTMPRYLTGLHR